MFKSKKSITFFIIIVLLFISIVFITTFDKRKIKAAGLAQIANLTNNGDTYPDSTKEAPKIPKYNRFELIFDIENTSATNFYWPYDPSPAPSIPQGVGITVNGLFSNDDWVTTLTMPAFYQQDYSRKIVGTSENIIPIGLPQWKIRFAPKEVSSWKYKISIVDSSGESVSLESSFNSVPSQDHGFVRVSPTDSRYFETSDGTTIIGGGINAEPSGAFKDSFDQVQAKMQNYGANGIQVVRWWMDYRGWQNPFGGGDSPISGGPQWSFSLQSLDKSGGAKVNDRYSAKLDVNKDTKQSIYLETGKTYRLTGSIKTNAITATAGHGVIPYAGTANGTAITGTNDWTTFSVEFTPSANNNYNFGVKNTGTAGTGYFDDLSVKATTDGGATWSGEYLAKGDMDWENYIDLKEAWKVDQIFSEAQKNGVYLKTVISEKQDTTLGSIQVDGSTGARSDNNFYASENHPSRWLQEAYWRYLAARWGAYESFHSAELDNEGDPFNGNNYNAANALADYLHNNYPRRLLASTSFWHSIPMEFWKNSSTDYIDVHEYVGPNNKLGSHGPRFYSWADGGGSASDTGSLLPFSSKDGSSSYDTTTAKSGERSLKLVSKLSAGNVSQYFLNNEYHIGINPNHTYALRFWAKGDNINNTGGPFAWIRPGINLTWSKAYHENDYVGGLNIFANLNTYNWTQFNQTGIHPASSANTANLNIEITCNLSTIGTFWIDNIEFIDEQTGQNLFVGGSFEDERIDYDTALLTQKYGVLLNSYGQRVGKPAIWGETGIRDSNTYDENTQLANDTNGTYIKKMVWAQAGPDNPNMLYWMTENIISKNLWHYYKAYANFMKNTEVSNGHYVDIAASTTDPNIRLFGQKDLTNNKAYLWIDNKNDTWKNEVDNVNIPAVSGTISFDGFKNDNYYLEWYNTSDGTITKKETTQVTEGKINLSVENLLTDMAVKIFPENSQLVTINKESDLREASSGNIITYTITVTNHDSSNVSALTLSDPINLSHVSFLEANYDGKIDNGTVTWPAIDLAANESKIYILKVKVNQL